MKNIRFKRGNITFDDKEIKRIVMDYYEHLYVNNWITKKK